MTGANYTPFSGIVSGDEVSINIATSGSYVDKNAGEGKQVSVSGLGLSGADAGNYQFASASISGDVGKITPAALTITASAGSKVYDGTTSSSAAPTVSGLMVGDSFSGLSQTYADKNAGNGKTLTVTGYTINDGNNGGNYTITLQNNTSGVITPAQLIYTAAAASREQDRDNPLLSGSISGIGSGDSLSGIASGSLTWLTTATKSSPAGRYAITGSGLSVIDGNYLADIIQAPGNATALTVRAQDAGYKQLLPWIIQGNDVGANSGQNNGGSWVPANGRNNQNPQGNGQYFSAGQQIPGGVGGAYEMPGLPLSIIGSGINTGNHGIAAAELLNLSQLERR